MQISKEIYFRSLPFASKRVLLSESLKWVFNNILSLLASLNANIPVCKTPKLVQLFPLFLRSLLYFFKEPFKSVASRLWSFRMYLLNLSLSASPERLSLLKRSAAMYSLGSQIASSHSSPATHTNGVVVNIAALSPLLQLAFLSQRGK